MLGRRHKILFACCVTVSMAGIAILIVCVLGGSVKTLNVKAHSNWTSSYSEIAWVLPPDLISLVKKRTVRLDDRLIQIAFVGPATIEIIDTFGNVYRKETDELQLGSDTTGRLAVVLTFSPFVPTDADIRKGADRQNYDLSDGGRSELAPKSKDGQFFDGSQGRPKVITIVIENRYRLVGP